jgi:hypothetical protein
VIAPAAAGLVKVNSTASTPPATSASVSGAAFERSSSRTTATTPLCSMTLLSTVFLAVGYQLSAIG